jgi:hypothetical protein
MISLFLNNLFSKVVGEKIENSLISGRNNYFQLKKRAKGKKDIKCIFSRIR